MNSPRRHTFHRSLLIIATLLVSFMVFPTSSQAQADDGIVPNEVVLKLFPGNDPDAIATQYKLRVIDQFGTRPIFRMAITDGKTPSTKAGELLADADKRVQYAEPNYVGQTPEGRQKASWSKGDKSNYTQQWAPTKLGLADVHKKTRGAGVTVAVLDTGVDDAHPALAGKLLPGYDFVDNDRDPSEVGVTGQDVAYGHGTHVAGLVALAAPDAKIVPLRVLDRSGAGNIWVLSEALGYAIDPDNNPATFDGAHVINLSLSFTRESALLEDIVKEATCDDDDQFGCDDDDSSVLARRGAVVVAAAGNSGSTTPEYPAAEAKYVGIDGMLAVAASTQTDTLATFSNRGDWVQIAAPGQDIVSAVPGGGYGAWSGTSMATPLTAGVAALLIAAEPTFRPNDVTSKLVSNGASIDGQAAKQLDAAKALDVHRTGAARQLFLPHLRISWGAHQRGA
jgi:subtilisin family serine protease